MKRIITILVTLALGFSANALFAATYSKHAPPKPVAMAPSTGFFIGVDALYFQPTNQDLDYGIEAPLVLNDPAVPLKSVYVDPEHDWGFRVMAGFRFNPTDDLSLTYTYLRTNDSTSKVAPDGSVIWPILPAIVEEFPATKAKANAKFDYDAVDLMLGHTLQLVPHLHLYLAAGLRYADIQSKLRASYSYTYTPTPVINQDHVKTDTVDLTSDFEGIGPRAAVTGIYNLGSGFNLIGSFGTSLLIGNGTLKHHEALTDEEIPTPDSSAVNQEPEVVDFKKSSYQHVVPEIDAKLGLGYVFHMQNRMALGVDVGWEVMNYFNVKDDDFSVTDVAFNGPYVGIAFTSF